jgi:hypothetical protein
MKKIILYSLSDNTFQAVLTLKRLICTVLTIILLIGMLSFVKIDVHGITVGRNITSDTHWTIDDNPVIFNSSITVYPNATLTIDPGVTVNLGSYPSFTISGTLIAVGTPENKITFTIPDNQTGTYSISFSPSYGLNQTHNPDGTFQYVNFNRVTLQSSSSVTVDNCYFSFSTTQTAIAISGGSLGASPIISNNKIVFNGFQDSGHYSYGISVNSGATPAISNNEFDGNGQLTGINLQIYTPTGMSSPSFTISNNLFSNCWLGIKAETAAMVTVQGNSFLGCRDGLYINVAASLTIRNNLIDGCSRYGINGGGVIDSNTISNCQIGIHNPPAGSVITNNNIIGNTVNSITASIANVSAQNNWWGIADASTIQTTIYDVRADYSLGTVTFMPFLNSPSLSAPAIPSTTPPITPGPTVDPTARTTQTTVTSAPTIMPTVSATSTPTKKSETILNDTGDLLNLNLITTAAVAIFALVWLVVIFGYVTISRLSRYRAKSKTDEK